MRNIAAGLALISLALCSGCGTLISHFQDRSDLPPPGPWRGVRWDADYAVHPPPEFNVYFAHIVDVPCSIIGDTITLPYDWMRAKNRETGQGPGDIKKDEGSKTKSE